MSIEKLKNAIKSRPFLYSAISPLLFPLRWLRRRNQNKFWSYCISVPTLVQEPCFVKVGTADGIMGDPLSPILLSNTNWRGLLIEPVPYFLERLKANFADRRRFVVEQVAIGATAGEATFYYVDPNAWMTIPQLPDWCEGLGSFDRTHIVKFISGVLEPFIVEHKVQVSRLSDVLQRNGIVNVHLLQIDAEGHDYEVLKTLDFTKYAPLLIFVEHTHLSGADKIEMVGLLRKLGYYVGDSNSDYFAFNEKAIKQLQAQA